MYKNAVHVEIYGPLLKSKNEKWKGNKLMHGAKEEKKRRREKEKKGERKRDELCIKDKAATVA